MRPAEAAQRATCAPYAKPIVLDFKTLAPPPVYNNRLSVQGIRTMFSSHTESVVGPHEKALGITYAETTYTAQAHSAASSAGGGYCVYLTDMDVDFGWKRMQVFIASEFKPGTCEYRTVLDHENQHVSVNNGALKEFAPRFRAEVERMLTRQQPVFASDAQRGMDQALASLDSGMSQLLHQFQDVIAQRNAPLDSAANYKATAQLCGNWDGASAPKVAR